MELRELDVRDEVKLRGYDGGDLEAMVELDAECFAPPFRFSKGAMRRFVEGENAWVVVAQAGVGLAGFCVVHREKTDAEEEVGYVVTIDVAKEWRGHGIGERMLSVGETWVRSWGGAGMMLHVFVENEGAIRFYERMKYGRMVVQRGFYGAGLDAALYWKVC